MWKTGVLDKDDVLQVVKFREVDEKTIEVITFNNQRFKCDKKYLKRVH
jgi:hypothetical protein